MEYCRINYKRNMYAFVYKHFIKLLINVQVTNKYVIWVHLYKIVCGV